MRNSSAAVCLGFLAAATTVADAHTPFKGASEFYTGLLHPVVAPGEALAIIALALLVGTSGEATSRRGLASFAAGLVVGLVSSRFTSASQGWTTPALLAVALVMAAIVTAGLRLPAGLAALLAAITGAFVGLDAAPEAPGRGALLSSAATTIGGLTVAIIVTGLFVNRHKHWQQVAMRVAGSWIAACAMLYFAWFGRHQM